MNYSNRRIVVVLLPFVQVNGFNVFGLLPWEDADILSGFP